MKLSFNSLKKHLKSLVFSLLNTQVRKRVSDCILNSSFNLFLSEFLNFIINNNQILSLELNDKSIIPKRLEHEVIDKGIVNKYSFILKLKLKLAKEHITIYSFFKVIYFMLINFQCILDISIDMGANTVSYRSLMILLKGLKNKMNLVKMKLNLRLDTLHSSHLQKLCDSISNQIHLDSLKLIFPFSNVGDSILCNLSKGLSKLTKLRKCIMNFDGYHFQYCKTIEEFSESIRFLKNLEILYLSLQNNSIGNRELRSLAYCFNSMTNLKKLKVNLQNNNLTDDEALLLKDSLKDLSKLIYLNISMENNKINEIGNMNLNMKVFNKIILESIN